MKLFSIITLLALALNFYPKNPEPKDYHIVLPEVEIKADSLTDLERKWCLFRNLGKELPITITPERFADHCMVVFWCESRLKPTAVNEDQQGFQQLTASTRRRLHLPRNITHLSFEEQIPFLKKYLLATKKVHLIKTSVDLHVINFAYARFHKQKLSSYIKGLDRDGDKIITRSDLLIFEENSIRKNKYIRSLK